MPADSRPRRFAAALTVALALLIAGCMDTPNSVFHSRTEFNRDVDWLFQLMIWLGTAVFIFVEGLLLYALWRFRHKPGAPRKPEQVHGNTKLEITWTVIPAVVLAVIAVPTVRTIFATQADAPANAVQVEVIGHQWWWEFRYPEYNLVTANEVYMPLGRPVNFHLKTADVIHSFWVPALGGKRDLINNRTNYLWFTPDSTTESVFNGFCAEYCGTSHANMRFRAFVVSPEEFDQWVANQQRTAAVVAPGFAAPAAPGASTPATQAAAGTPGQFVGFPAAQLPPHAVPQTPIPAGLQIDTTLTGDVQRGATLVASGVGLCIGCHTIGGTTTAHGTTGPNLTHVGSRLTIAGGLYPNDRRHLTAWIKNAPAMKPGSIMPALAAGQYDAVTKQTLQTGLNDQQIADIVAYLMALK